MTLAFFRDLSALVESHGRLVMATVVSATGSTPRSASTRMLLLPDDTTRGTVGGGKFESLVLDEARTLLKAGGPPRTREFSFRPEGPDSFGAVCGGRATVFLEVVTRPDRLLVLGAGHCGRALARAAAFTGFEVTVADDREELLEPEEFPAGTTLVKVEPDYAGLPATSPADAAAIVTRGHLTDGLALRGLRGRPLRYLGMMGSKAKRKTLYDELRKEGWREEELERIHSPIGLPIGAESPEEIAIAIVAEVVQAFRGKAGTP